MAPETQPVPIYCSVEEDLPQHWLQKRGPILSHHICENDIRIDLDADKHLVYYLALITATEKETCKAGHGCVTLQPQNQDLLVNDNGRDLRETTESGGLRKAAGCYLTEPCGAERSLRAQTEARP